MRSWKISCRVLRGPERVVIELHITAIENYKGGVGKTTTAVNLAYNLANNGYRTLLVDMDPQQSSAYLLRARKRKKNLEDVLAMRTETRKAVHRCVFGDRLYLLTGGDGMDSLDLNHIDLRFALDSCKDDYDFCIIDCNPGMTMLTVNALVAADDVIVPLIPDAFGAEGLKRIKDYIDQAKEYNPDIHIAGCLATMFNGRASQIRTIRRIMESGEVKVFDTCISNSEAVNTALEARKPVSLHRSRSTAAEDYKNFTEEYLKEVLGDGERLSDPCVYASI